MGEIRGGISVSANSVFNLASSEVADETKADLDDIWFSSPERRRRRDGKTSADTIPLLLHAIFFRGYFVFPASGRFLVFADWGFPSGSFLFCSRIATQIQKLLPLLR